MANRHHTGESTLSHIFKTTSSLLRAEHTFPGISPYAAGFGEDIPVVKKPFDVTILSAHQTELDRYYLMDAHFTQIAEVTGYTVDTQVLKIGPFRVPRSRKIPVTVGDEIAAQQNPDIVRHILHRKLTEYTEIASEGGFIVRQCALHIYAVAQGQTITQATLQQNRQLAA